MRTVLICAALLLWISGIIYGSPAARADADADARAALSLAGLRPPKASWCDCMNTGACICPAGNCSCNSGKACWEAKPLPKTAATHASDPSPGPGYVRTLGTDGVWGPWHLEAVPSMAATGYVPTFGTPVAPSYGPRLFGGGACIGGH